MPNIKPHFAVKSDPDPMVIRVLHQLGCGFDCASIGEIRQVLRTGCDPSDIIFANTIKSPSALKYAKSCGVDLMTFDNAEELRKISQIFPSARYLPFPLKTVRSIIVFLIPNMLIFLESGGGGSWAN